MSEMPNIPTPSIVQIYAGRLFDSYTGELLDNRLITVSPESGLVIDVQNFSVADVAVMDFAGPHVLDFRGVTVLPGFVDAHVHFFLHPYSETSWDDQLTKETITERTVRATIHARRTLMAGYTAVRDLGTEGAGDADVALRKCISGPDALIPGPRYFCANRAIVTTGSYGPKSPVYANQEGIDGIIGAEVADGVIECKKAVRRQVSAGADVIKIYSDYRARSRMSDVNPAISKAALMTFDDYEYGVMISTAHQLGVKVAVHSSQWRSGALHDKSWVTIDTIEHGPTFDDDPDNDGRIESFINDMRLDQPHIYWVPTLAAYYTMDGEQGVRWNHAARTFKAAIAAGVKRIACGGDTGVFAHGENSLEMKLMVRLGADWRTVLRWGTLGGWECIRSIQWEGKQGQARLAKVEELGEDVRVVGDNDIPFGAIRKGFAADIIATCGDLDSDFERAVDKSSIVFVMKGGKVFKRDGRDVMPV